MTSCKKIYLFLVNFKCSLKLLQKKKKIKN